MGEVYNLKVILAPHFCGSRICTKEELFYLRNF
jgi:hypothetical protein